MAVARYGNVLVFGTTADVHTGMVRVKHILCVGDVSNAGTFTFKDGAGNVIGKVYVGTNLTATPPVQQISVDTDIEGLEMDANPANGAAYVYIK